MCLTLSIEFQQSDLPKIQEAIGSQPIHILNLSIVKKWFKKPTILTLSDVVNGCGCGLLCDSANWNNKSWDMKPEMLPKLENTIRYIRSVTTGPIIFRAHWVSEKSNEQINITIDELSKTILKSQVETKKTYLIF